MKKIIFLFVLSVLAASCSSVYREDPKNCRYYDPPGLYYLWKNYPEEKILCGTLNQKLEKNKKGAYSNLEMSD